ncbi:MAG: hypothetical protein ACLFMR_05510 [Desulfohalobiaceae bacterium]
MKKVFFIPLLAFIVTMVIMLYLSKDICIYNSYEKNVRPYLFFGFLTIGSFLLSLKTSILLTLKEKLFDSEEYKNRFKLTQQLDPRKKRYQPVEELGNLLLYSVAFALLTSIMHFTLGFIPSDIIASICISVSASVISLVFLCWWFIRINLQEWFKGLKESEKIE